MHAEVGVDGIGSLSRAAATPLPRRRPPSRAEAGLLLARHERHARRIHTVAGRVQELPAPKTISIAVCQPIFCQGAAPRAVASSGRGGGSSCSQSALMPASRRRHARARITTPSGPVSESNT